MSKNNILYRVGLWIFLFTLAGSFIFAYLQGRYPENLDVNLAHATTLGFIFSLFLMTVFAYCVQSKQTPTAAINQNEPKIVVGEIDYQSGTLTEKDGLPRDYTINFENASHHPIISTVDSKDLHYLKNSGMFFTVVKFGNGKIIIESRDGTVDLREADNIKITVKYQEETKISFGYKTKNQED